jgi:hypothetical protein
MLPIGKAKMEDESRKEQIEEKGQPTDNEIRKLSIEETHITIRRIFTGGWIVASLWIIKDAVVEITSRPDWRLALDLFLIAVGSGTIQVPLLWRIWAYVRRWTKTHVAREAQLERNLDPSRSSSRMLEDGTDPSERRP